MSGLIEAKCPGHSRRSYALVELATLLSPESGLPAWFALPFWQDRKLQAYWEGRAESVRKERTLPFPRSRQQGQVGDAALALLAPNRFFEQIRLDLLEIVGALRPLGSPDSASDSADDGSSAGPSKIRLRRVLLPLLRPDVFGRAGLGTDGKKAVAIFTDSGLPGKLAAERYRSLLEDVAQAFAKETRGREEALKSARGAFSQKSGHEPDWLEESCRGIETHLARLRRFGVVACWSRFHPANCYRDGRFCPWEDGIFCPNDADFLDRGE